MIRLHFEKLSRYERKGEFAEAAVPFAQGVLSDPSCLRVRDGGDVQTPQTNVTAKWPDGSVKWLHLSFIADLPANAGKDLWLCADGAPPNVRLSEVSASLEERSFDTGALQAVLAPKGSGRLFDCLRSGGAVFSAADIVGPVLTCGGASYTARLEDDWRLCEAGPRRVIVRNHGRHVGEGERSLFDFDVRLFFTAGNPWVQIEYRIVHREEAASLPLEGLTLFVHFRGEAKQTTVCTSNYASHITTADAAQGVSCLIDAEHLLYEANEQIPETLYGTFFADCRTAGRGVCATIFQAHQNFPKALAANARGLTVSLMPEGQAPVVFLQGVAKTHDVFLHLHDGGADIRELNVRSLQMQMPDRPMLDAAVYAASGALENVFPTMPFQDVETYLTLMADGCGKAYGMLNWGDAPDMSYTQQGRGRGALVWINQEYDYSHACLLMLARSGQRRFLDKLLVTTRHWMDVDICHHSADPMRLGGQIIHSAYHATQGVTPSHEWVEGLLDYYHLTGNRRAYMLALGIGENVMRQLTKPQFQQKGETSARETGWALRTFAALYQETHDDKWLQKCEWIVEHFRAWEKEFGVWLSPYTDHSVVRVPFMIAVAAVSLSRYHAVRPSDELKGMIVRAMDDLIDNCIMPGGLFYYKELPSLRNLLSVACVLEALACAYALTRDKKYLQAGMPTLQAHLRENRRVVHDLSKAAVGDAVTVEGASPKFFAQAHLPIAGFCKCLEEAGMTPQ